MNGSQHFKGSCSLHLMGSRKSRRILLGLLAPTVLQNIRKCLCFDTALHPSRPESSTPLSQPQISCLQIQYHAVCYTLKSSVSNFSYSSPQCALFLTHTTRKFEYFKHLSFWTGDLTKHFLNSRITTEIQLLH